MRVIPQNMEKFLSLKVGQLKFIDSFQFTPKGLDVLAKTLADDEFRYFRESCTSNHFVSSNAKVSIPTNIWIALTDLTRLNCLRRMRSLANCIVVLVRTRSIHTQLECELPLDVGPWQITTTSTCSWMYCSLQTFFKSFVQPV